MRRLLRLLFDSRGTHERLVVVETADSLGYRVERIPAIPDTAEDFLAVTSKESA